MIGDTYSIIQFSNLLNKDLFLPIIQRPFEWNEERIERLFDSIVKKMPIGLILLFKHSENFTIYGRDFFKIIDENTRFEDKYRPIEKEKIMVLDGQQRLQALFLGIYGNYFGKTLFHDLFHFKGNRDQELIDPSFILRKTDEQAFILRNDNGISSLYLSFPRLISLAQKITNTTSYDLDPNILDELQKLFDPFLLNERQIEQIYSYLSNTIISSFFIPNPSIFKFQLIQDKNFDEVLEIFVRFNQGGMVLSKSDLIFSTLKLKWKDAGKVFEDLHQDTGINKDILLKTLIVVSDISASTKLYKISRDINKLKSNFEMFKEIIELFYDRIKKLTGTQKQILNRFNFLIPVIYYFFKNPNLLKKNQSLSDLPNVLQYILIIVFNSNLRSDNYIDHIVKLIYNSSNGEFPIDTISDFLESKNVKTYLDAASLNSNPILTYSLIQRNNWDPIYYRNRLHIDHIFPQAIINEFDEELQPFVDSIWNKYIVFAGDNIRKWKSYPSDYFAGEKDNLIDEYIIPKDYLSVKDFYQFIQVRRDKIIDLFKKINVKIVDEHRIATQSK